MNKRNRRTARTLGVLLCMTLLLLLTACRNPGTSYEQSEPLGPEYRQATYVSPIAMANTYIEGLKAGDFSILYWISAGDDLNADDELWKSMEKQWQKALQTHGETVWENVTYQTEEVHHGDCHLAWVYRDGGALAAGAYENNVFWQNVATENKIALAQILFDYSRDASYKSIVEKNLNNEPVVLGMVENYALQRICITLKDGTELSSCESGERDLFHFYVKNEGEGWNGHKNEILPPLQEGELIGLGGEDASEQTKAIPEGSGASSFIVEDGQVFRYYNPGESYDVIWPHISEKTAGSVLLNKSIEMLCLNPAEGYRTTDDGGNNLGYWILGDYEVIREGTLCKLRFWWKRTYLEHPETVLAEGAYCWYYDERTGEILTEVQYEENLKHRN